MKMSSLNILTVCLLTHQVVNKPQQINQVSKQSSLSQGMRGSVDDQVDSATAFGDLDHKKKHLHLEAESIVYNA